ncbi:hypothetical protein SLEP1_g59094 [Rubroshorea leprosula]|uniref:Uncharacterized protein n=1 Tax=Rubroshorea leprosula TaxID=152421 RepID=A0AAV5MRD8_9ROSI|nr:hypothetical protein SLEP1_g59094 [Rubroshorea leprosula]
MDSLMAPYRLPSLFARFNTRFGNSAADFMAALGHNFTTGIILFKDPPVGISMIMHGNCVAASFLRV